MPGHAVFAHEQPRDLHVVLVVELAGRKRSVKEARQKTGDRCAHAGLATHDRTRVHAAVKTATKLAKLDHPAQRWVGTDALKDITGPSVIKKVRTTKA